MGELSHRARVVQSILADRERELKPLLQNCDNETRRDVGEEFDSYPGIVRDIQEAPIMRLRIAVLETEVAELRLERDDPDEHALQLLRARVAELDPDSGTAEHLRELLGEHPEECVEDRVSDLSKLAKKHGFDSRRYVDLLEFLGVVVKERARVTQLEQEVARLGVYAAELEAKSRWASGTPREADAEQIWAECGECSQFVLIDDARPSEDAEGRPSGLLCVPCAAEDPRRHPKARVAELEENEREQYGRIRHLEESRSLVRKQLHDLGEQMADMNRKALALEALRDELVAVLRSVEWSADVDGMLGGTVSGCPDCEAEKSDAYHFHGCGLAAALARAQVQEGK